MNTIPESAAKSQEIFIIPAPLQNPEARQPIEATSPELQEIMVRVWLKDQSSPRREHPWPGPDPDRGSPLTQEKKKPDLRIVSPKPAHREKNHPFGYLKTTLLNSPPWRDLTLGEIETYRILRAYVEKSKRKNTHYATIGQNQISLYLQEIKTREIATTTGEEKAKFEHLGTSVPSVQRYMRKLKSRWIISLVVRGAPGKRVAKWRVRLSWEEVLKDQIPQGKKNPES